MQTAVGTEEDITDINSQNSNDSDARKAQNDNESRSSVLDLTMTSFHTGQMKAVSIESVSTPDAYPMCSSFIEQQEDELQEKDERQVSTPPVHCYQKKYHTSPNISEMMSAYEDNYEVDSLSSISNSDLKVGSVVCEDSTENKCHSLDTASTSSCIRQDQEMALAKSSELYRTEQGGSSPNISEVMSSCDEHQTTESISSCNSGYAEAEVVGIRGSEWLQGMGKTVSVPKPSVRSLPVKHINNKNAVDLIKKMKKVK